MTSADIETLVALVERWQRMRRAVLSSDDSDDALDRDEMEAEGDLLAWKRPAPADTPPDIQVGDVVVPVGKDPEQIKSDDDANFWDSELEVVEAVYRTPIWTRPKGGTT